MQKHKSFAPALGFLWRAMRPYRFHYAVMLSAPILGAFYFFSCQYALKLLVDAFSGPTIPTNKQLLLPIGLFVGGQILVDIIWRIGDVAEWRSEPYVRRSILLRTFDYVQHHSYAFFQNTHAGLISSKIKGILEGYDHFWAGLHHEFTNKLAGLVILTATLSLVNWTVFSFMSLWVVITFWLTNRLSTKLNSLSFDYANQKHAIFGQIGDCIANIFTLFSFASRQRELDRLDSKIQTDYIPSELRVYYYASFLRVIMGILYWLMLISIFFFMIHLRRQEQVTTGDFVFVMGVSLHIAEFIWTAVHKVQDFMKQMGDYRSAYSLMETPQEDEPHNLPDIVVKQPGVIFEQVCFAYPSAQTVNKPEKMVFHDLSFSITNGEKIGLVGSSGAGKSTLVSLLLKYFTPQSGQISVDGQNIIDYSADSLRRNIALIPQDIMLFHRSILENIRYGKLDADDEAVMEAAKLANIHEYIMQLPAQYHSYVGERGIKLSGGQRQRIAIARAFLKNAPILILDEATSSLDAETEKLIQNSLNVLLEKQNTTVIAIAHRLSTLKHMDRIIVLDKGKIIEEGKHELLISQDSFYRRLWEMQQI